MAARKKKVAEPEPPAPEPPKEEEFIELTSWNGIEIEARYKPMYIGSPHIELHVKDKRPIPVSDTGYRSRFDPNLPVLIEAAGGIAFFVQRWMDAEADSPEWKRAQAPKQLDLFG